MKKFTLLAIAVLMSAIAFAQKPIATGPRPLTGVATAQLQHQNLLLGFQFRKWEPQLLNQEPFVLPRRFRVITMQSFLTIVFLKRLRLKRICVRAITISMLAVMQKSNRMQLL